MISHSELKKEREAYLERVAVRERARQEEYDKHRRGGPPEKKRFGTIAIGRKLRRSEDRDYLPPREWDQQWR